MSNPLQHYLAEIQREFARKEAREHAYRPALKQLLESLGDGFHAINDPAHIPAGAPDFAVYKGNIPIGFVEAKDITVDLAREEQSDQMGRYLKALPNLILTNQLEFRWYVGGELRNSVRIGDITNGKIKLDPGRIQDLEHLLKPFAVEKTPTVSSPRDLAIRMADMAREITYIIEKNLTGDNPSAALQQQMTSFQATLIPDLTVKQFADMYAQTIAYGLFAARMRWNGLGEFNRMEAYWKLMPATNPFLKSLFREMAPPELDPPQLGWVVDNLVELMRHTDMEAILKDFGKRTRQEDPVVHFYETFLSEYDPQVRERRGVYYTPEPVVSYIVRSVDHILRERFNRPMGLADPDTLILDPATGTGTFLYFVIQQIYEAMRQDAGFWNQYVADNLLPRIFGFELLMAPYTIAHMKLAMQLQQMGYQFHDRQRLGIYLTNTLEEAIHASERLPFANFITEEANQAAAIKKDEPIMVVLGNPPYSYESSNTGEWITGLTGDYYQVDGKPLGESNPRGLQDDYVKFIRFAQWRIEKTGHGILAFVTNHGYLDNLTFRGMRQHLMNSFTDIFIIDLHGNMIKRETAPDGSPDQNVFDIRQGVAIGIFVKERGKSSPAKVHHISLWGHRNSKYATLLENDITTTDWIKLSPDSPFYLFTPQNIDLRKEYDTCWQLAEVFQVNTPSLYTARDSLAIQYSDKDIWNTVNDFASLPVEQAREKYELGQDSLEWKVSLAQEDLKSSGLRFELVRPIYYRPLDTRFTYYTGKTKGFICRPRPEVMRHMLKDNLGLILGRAGQAADIDEWNVISCADTIVDYNVFRRGGGTLFPLYLYPDPNQLLHTSDWTPGKGGRVPNLNPAFIREMETKLGLRFTYARTDSVGADVKDGAVQSGTAATPNRRPSSALDSSPAAPDTRADSSPHIPSSVGAGSRALHNGLGTQNHAAAPHSVGAGAKDGALHPGTAATSESPSVTRPGVSHPEENVGGLRASDNDEFAQAMTPADALEIRPYNRTFTPEDVFYYAYAIFHSPTYRARYAEFLKIDFPRLPLTSDVSLFRQLCEYGKSLVDLHLMKTPLKTDITFPVAGNAVVENRYPRYEPGTGGFNPLPDHDSPGARGLSPLFEAGGPLSDHASPGTGDFNPLPGRVYINPTQYFDGIPADVWEFHIGGYQVLEKWLKDRRGRTLTYHDLQHYKQMVAALQKTIQLMDAIDTAIPAWPL